MKNERERLIIWLRAWLGRYLSDVQDVRANRNVDQIAALLRAPEKKASKEVLRLAALGRLVERMPEAHALCHSASEDGAWTYGDFVSLNWRRYEWARTPTDVLRSARIAKKKGRKA